MVTERIDQLSIEDYVRLYEEEGAFEIIAGQRRPIMPPVMMHVWMIKVLARILDDYCRLHKLGEVLTESPYVISYDSKWVTGSRVPDLMFFTKARWEGYIKNEKEWASKPMLIVPDMVIEVVSQNDRYSEINEKVRVYEKDGVTLIWVIDPHKKTADVYESGKRQALSESDTLSGGAVLPNLDIVLVELFRLPSGD
jgi:Uma2 family endonuclease